MHGCNSSLSLLSMVLERKNSNEEGVLSLKLENIVEEFLWYISKHPKLAAAAIFYENEMLVPFFSIPLFNISFLTLTTSSHRSSIDVWKCHICSIKVSRVAKEFNHACMMVHSRLHFKLSTNSIEMMLAFIYWSCMVAGR